MPPKKKTTKRKPRKKSQTQIEKLLLENFIVLQKVLADLSVKFETMSGEISKLLALFEVSAKSFVEKQGTQISKEDKAFLEKLDQLIDQNKVIAKGLTLMEERIRDRPTQTPQPMIRPKLIPRL